MSQSVQRKHPRKSHISESSQQSTPRRVKTLDSVSQVKKPRSKKLRVASPTANSLNSIPMSNCASSVSSNTGICNSMSVSIDQSNPHPFVISSNNNDLLPSIAYPVVSIGNLTIPSQSFDSIPPPLINPLENASEIFDFTIAPFIKANNEIQQVIKTRIYRHMFVSHIQKAITTFYPQGINIADLVLLALEIMKTLGLF